MKIVKVPLGTRRRHKEIKKSCHAWGVFKKLLRFISEYNMKGSCDTYMFSYFLLLIFLYLLISTTVENTRCLDNVPLFLML